MNRLNSAWGSRAHLLWRTFLSATLTLGLTSAADALADDPAPSEQRCLQEAERCKALLRENLINFYLPHCVDNANGGYLESVRDGKFAPTGEKFLTLQARQLWFFSTLAIEGYEREKALAVAKTGFDFLQTKMLDRSFGGYYSKVSDAGDPKDRRKHVYLNSFALYGLVAYYRASKDASALQAAQNLFRILDAKAHDPGHGGYVEFFYDDWKPITDPAESRYVGAIGVKTYNTHLHLLEAFAELYRAWPDETVRRRLEELVVINTSTVRQPTFESNVDAFQPDWTVVREPQNLRASFGHDVECVWLTLDAVRALGLSVDLYRSWSVALCKSSVDFGYDKEHGGFFSSGPLGQAATDTKKVWWVEAEALVSMLDMWTLTGDDSYFQKFKATLDFVEKFQAAKEGSWWASLAADGSSVGDRQRTGPWQGGYHAGRAMMFCAKRLEEAARRAQQAGSGASH